MGDFFQPPSGFSPVPPEPATPPPNFEDIGASIWAGVAKTAGPGGWLNGLYEILVRVVTFVVGFLLGILVRVFAYVIELIDKTLDVASDSFGNLIAATFKSLFGVEVSPASVNTRLGGPDRAAIAQQLGKTITNTLFSGATAIAGGGILPSDVAANNYLAVVMNMEINGWIESWFTDGLSGHILEKYGDLKDGISHVLGLGRMSRQVFAAPIKILVHDPYTALLNAKYRPKPPQEQTVIEAFFRSDIDSGQVSDILSKQGYTEQEISWAIARHYKFLPLADVDYLLARQTWTDADAKQYLAGQGYATNSQDAIVAVLNDKRTFKYRAQMVQVAETAYVEGNMDLTTFQQIVSTLNLTQEETTWISNVATLKRSVKVTHLSLGQIEQGIKDGILSFTDLQTWAVRVNMPEDELAWLELMIQFQANKQTATAAAKAAAAKAKATAAQAKAAAAAAKAAAAQAQAADKGVTVAQAETLVTDGLWTFDQLTAFLTAKGYGGDAIDAIVSLLHTKLAKTAAGATTKAAAASSLGAKGLSLAETEKAVVAGVLSIGNLQAWLTTHGFDVADTQTIVELTQDAIDAAKVKAAAKAAAVAKAADKQISLPELERAARLGLTTIDAYNTALKSAGFDAISIALLDGILNQQIAADKATAATRASKASAGTSKGVTLAQLEQEVIEGIRPIGDFTTELVTLGYSPADQTDLTELLQARVDQAQATARKRVAAGQQLLAQGVSLKELETAVKLGVAPIATYTQLLQASGHTADAVQLLTNSLLAQVAKVKKTQVAANGAGTALAAKGISLPQLEAAIIAGLEPIASYTNTLRAGGYSSADAGTLTELLQLKVDHAAAVAATHADAEGVATQRGISLASEEAGVIAGVLAMNDYDALLIKLGFDSFDRSVLEQLLQAKVDAAAAKAKKTSPPPAGGTPAGTG
jgi:hypothetical protein